VRDLNIPTTTQTPDAKVIGQYFYDGSGKRIKKVTNSETTIFVYSGSKLIAEYSTQQAANPTISYTATDMLGSPRVITDANGQVISRRDFMAFGEEIAVGVGGRATTSKYGQSDSVRQRFTGYQKDEETGLDFAEARYYNDAHGRFTAVDPLLASGKSANPQTFNRYVYSMNRPLIMTDPTGMQAATKPKPKDSTPKFTIDYVEVQRKDYNGEKIGRIPVYGEVVRSDFEVKKDGKSVTPFETTKFDVKIQETVTNLSDTIVEDGKVIDTPQSIKDGTTDINTKGANYLYDQNDRKLGDLQGAPATSASEAQKQRELQRTSVDKITFSLIVKGKEVASTTIISTKTIDTVTIVVQPPPPVVKPPVVKKPKKGPSEEE
jgi:RHS repeat-associated protein